MSYANAATNSSSHSNPEYMGASSAPATPDAKKARMNPSTMVEWLNSDANTPSLALQYLQWQDIAHLSTVSKSWRDYISNPKHHVCGSMQTLRTFPQKLVAASKSAWMPRCLQSLHFISKSSSVEPDFFTYSRYSGAFQLSLLPSFKLLKLLQFDTLPLIFIPEMFEPISQLTSLQSLIVRCVSTEMRLWERFAKVSFAPLAKCKELATLKVQLGTSFCCTKQQVLDLLECKSLTSLDCGVWTDIDDAAKAMSRTSEQRTAEGLALLHQLPRLQHLELTGQPIGRTELQHLSKIITLTTIKPFSWRSTIDAQQWEQLLELPALSELSFCPGRGSNQSSINAFLDILPQMSNLVTFFLTEVSLQKEQLESILSLQRLSSLNLFNCQIASLNSFSGAPSSLYHLYLHNCTDFQGRTFNYHIDLPVIPSLQRLQIYEGWYAENEWSASARLSNPLRAMIVAFKFMLSKRFSLPDSSIEYMWPARNEVEQSENLMYLSDE